MLERPCLKAGCPEFTTRTRCPEHERQCQRDRDERRGNSRQRGYDAEYVRNRKAVLAGAPACAWGCGRPATTADHVLPLAMGGTNGLDNLMPACGPCNASRGSRRAPTAWTIAGNPGR